MKMKKLYQELLNEFCSTDEHRIQIQKPFFDGIDICATDARFLLRVKPDACGLHLPVSGPKRIEITQPCNKTLSVEALIESFNHVDCEEEEILVSPAIPCDECYGTGSVEYEYQDKAFHTFYQECDCPVCKGSGDKVNAVYSKTGKMIPKQLEPIAINNVAFCAYRLFCFVDICRQLNVSEVKITNPREAEPCLFHINDECEFILMPITCIGGDAKYSIQTK